MKRLRVVSARQKVRDIRSVDRRRSTASDTKVVDLRAYTGRNVIPFPDGPTTPAA